MKMRTYRSALLFSFLTGMGFAQTMQELIDDGKNTENVTTQSMGYDRKSYSPLKQINKSNIKRLVPIWSTSLMNDQGELAAPTIYNGVMYAINAKWTFAIDVATGRQIWRTPAEWPPEAAAQACCGVTNRGAATIYNGKLYRVTLDAHVLALDMKTGKQVWKQKFAEFKEQKKELAPQLAEKTGSHLVMRVGNVMVLHRPKPAANASGKSEMGES